jgi:hypothetical protein
MRANLHHTRGEDVEEVVAAVEPQGSGGRTCIALGRSKASVT